MTEIPLQLEWARVYVEAVTGPTRLDHPECVAVAPDGSIWAGGEAGQIYRISGEPPSVEVHASTGGFCLGLAFDHTGDALYVCDLDLAALVEVDLLTGAVSVRKTDPSHGPVGVPNFPVVLPNGDVLVSDSSPSADGASIWRFPKGGPGVPWCPPGLAFANGMAFDVGLNCLDVIEGHARRLVRVDADRPTDPPVVVADLSPRVPDGVTIGRSGRRYVGCYAPNEIAVVADDGSVETLLADPDGHLLAAPTNVAFSGSTLLVANFSRWHITAIDTEDAGMPLPAGAEIGR